MKSFLYLSTAFVALLQTAAAGVSGAAEGFAKGVTGGGSAASVTPKTTAELVKYLNDNTPRVILLDRTFDFRGTEGTASENGCAPWGTGAACQTAINKDNWCGNYQKNAPTVSVKYSKAGLNPINVGSNKSIVGVGNKGVILGKGLRMHGGAKNIIIQNIKISDLNPQYVWGGDAITMDGVDMVWIDHVTTSLIGRQHIVLGNGASNRVTISNCHIDGASSWSAQCNGHHYWAIYFTGSNDLVTFKGNYIAKTSGRGPKVSGNSLLHAVNNYWYDTDGHAFEIDNGGKVLVEGSVFQNVKQPIETASFKGQLYAPTSVDNTCSSGLGRACQPNGFGTSGTLDGKDSSFLANFKGKNVAAAGSYASAKNVPNTAGFGKL